MAPMTQTGKTPHAEVERLKDGTTGQVVKLNDGLTRLSVITQLVVVSRTIATAPGSPDEGDAYIMPSGSLTGWAAGAVEHDICFWSNGWQIIKPYLGFQCRVDNPELGLRLYFTGTSWVEDYEWGSAEIGLTASTTQTQGQMPLTKSITLFSTVANAGDACTLPVPRASMVVVVANFGANALQIFPPLNCGIDANGDDVSVSLATTKTRLFIGISATNYVSLISA